MFISHHAAMVTVSLIGNITEKTELRSHNNISKKIRVGI